MSSDDASPAPARCPACHAPTSGHPETDPRCPACYERDLRLLDADFLDTYARFGARSRRVVAEACLRALVLSDIADRKLLAITIYEQFTAAATDFIGLYYALLHRRRSPIAQSVLGFKLDEQSAVGFFGALANAGPTDLLETLGLPHPDQVPGTAKRLDARERRQVRTALLEVMSDLQRALGYRDVGEQVLVSAAAGFGSVRALVDRTGWLVERELEADQVAALALDPRHRRLEVAYLNTSEETLGAVVDGIDVMTRLTRNIIFAFVSLHDSHQFRNGFPPGPV
jgi:hypothetical protein